VREAHRQAPQAVPRLGQRLVEVPFGPPEWCDDPAFALDAHLEFVTLPKPGSERQLLDLAQEFAMAPFDRTRPPWAARVVEGLEGGRAAYILKLHHAMADGISIVQLLSYLHSKQRAPRASRPAFEAAQQQPLPSAREIAARRLRRQMDLLPAQLRKGLADLRRGLRADPEGRSMVSRAASFIASARRVLAPEPVPNSPLLAGRNNQWRFEVLELPLPAFKAAAKAAGATLNDAFISGLLGGFRRYHQHFGVAIEEIPITFPISIRREGEAAGGNRFAPGQFAGPIGEADPVERMRRIGEQVLRIRDEPALALPLAVMPLMAQLPAAMVAKLMTEKLLSADLQISNVPGIREPVYLAGAEITQVFPFAPLPGVPAMISLVSHGASCCIGFNLDGAAITEPELLMRHMRESFDEVLALAAAKPA
jgi:WS/DGAT/MGAT family acyltransferase